jgi:hypothetical protein
MQEGLGLQDLAATIVAQAKEKTDLLANNEDIRSIHFEDAESSEPVHAIQVGKDHVLRPNEVFNGQLARELRIPKPYFDRMATESPALLDQNVNEWLGAPEYREKRRMVRSLGTTARAYLSDSYRPLDNVDLAQAVLPAVRDLDLVVKSSQITDRRMYIQAVSPRLEGEVKVGDAVQAGIVISNSEVGVGSLRIEHMIYRLICLNGWITGDVIRRSHIGRSRGQDQLDIGVQEYYRDSTRKLDDAAFFSKVRDAVEHTVSEASFEVTLAQLRGSTEVRIPNPSKGVELVSKKLELTEGEEEALLANLIDGGDLSAWGMGNAVTALANTVEDYDRAVELERAGKTVIELPKSDWERVAKLAA